MALARPGSRSASGTLARAARAAGFSRIECVRIVRTGGASRAEVTGVLHRYPQTVPVSLATATRLAAAGAPLRIEQRGTT